MIQPRLSVEKDMVFVCILMSWALEYVGDCNCGWPQADRANLWWAQTIKTHNNSGN
jgi:hypothetical protein